MGGGAFLTQLARHLAGLENILQARARAQHRWQHEAVHEAQLMRHRRRHVNHVRRRRSAHVPRRERGSPASCSRCASPSWVRPSCHGRAVRSPRRGIAVGELQSRQVRVGNLVGSRAMLNASSPLPPTTRTCCSVEDLSLTVRAMAARSTPRNSAGTTKTFFRRDRA